MATKPVETETATKDTTKAEKPRGILSEPVAGIAAVLVFVLFVNTFIVQAFEIPSRSMIKTLMVGDHVFVDRLTPVAGSKNMGPLMPYREVHRGDVIVFLSPLQRGLHVVKRVIGIPGDRIHLRDGIVYRNGVALNEPYAIHSGIASRYADNFPSVPPEFGGPVALDWPGVVRMNMQGEDLVIPSDKYFGLGDNRDDSLDSRYWGFIPRANIIGRPLLIYWSFDMPEDSDERIGFVAIHFFDQTRWRRMFQIVR
ncbi:MAG TPA: signal peptidase I [Candidatus Angelobacter sp.]|nr:signal peptidase I [Candidatus Angelobacter sp.]